jgi:hypothetical protein
MLSKTAALSSSLHSPQLLTDSEVRFHLVRLAKPGRGPPETCIPHAAARPHSRGSQTPCHPNPVERKLQASSMDSDPGLDTSQPPKERTQTPLASKNISFARRGSSTRHQINVPTLSTRRVHKNSRSERNASSKDAAFHSFTMTTTLAILIPPRAPRHSGSQNNHVRPSPPGALPLRQHHRPVGQRDELTSQYKHARHMPPSQNHHQLFHQTKASRLCREPKPRPTAAETERASVFDTENPFSPHQGPALLHHARGGHFTMEIALR